MFFLNFTKIFSTACFIFLFHFQENVFSKEQTNFTQEDPFFIQKSLGDNTGNFFISNNNNQFLSSENPEVKFDESTVFSCSDDITFNAEENSFKLTTGGCYSIVIFLKVNENLSYSPIPLNFLINNENVIRPMEFIGNEKLKCTNSSIQVIPGSTLKVVVNNGTVDFNSIDIMLTSISELRSKLTQ